MSNSSWFCCPSNLSYTYSLQHFMSYVYKAYILFPFLFYWRHKTRLLAKGYSYTRQESVDCMETFSPVSEMTAVKLVLTLVGAKHRHLHQLDVNNVFLRSRNMLMMSLFDFTKETLRKPIKAKILVKRHYVP